MGNFKKGEEMSITGEEMSITTEELEQARSRLRNEVMIHEDGTGAEEFIKDINVVLEALKKIISRQKETNEELKVEIKRLQTALLREV